MYAHAYMSAYYTRTVKISFFFLTFHSVAVMEVRTEMDRHRENMSAFQFFAHSVRLIFFFVIDHLP